MPSETKNATSSSGGGGFELPPLVEWHSFQLTQLVSTADFFISEVKNVDKEYVRKFETDLVKEDYKSSKISGRILRELKRIVAKTVADLKELTEQAEEEWTQRFSSSSSKQDTTSSSSSSKQDSASSSSSSKQDSASPSSSKVTVATSSKSVNGIRGLLDDLSDVSDSDGNCTTVDGSSPEKEVNQDRDSSEEKILESSDDELNATVDEKDKEAPETSVNTVTEVNETEDKGKDDANESTTTMEVDVGELESEVKNKSDDQAPVSPEGTVFLEPVLKSKTRKIRSPSPPETVFLGPPEKKTPEIGIVPISRIRRNRPRSPSPADTVLMDRKKDADSDDDSRARRNVLAGSLDEDDDDAKARRSVLSGNLAAVKIKQEKQERKSRKRSPSPAETVLLRSTAEESDSEDEFDRAARRSVLSGGGKAEKADKKPNVNAPFKRPKPVVPKLKDSDDDDDETPSTSKGKSEDKPRSGKQDFKAADAGTKDDWKLGPKACSVVIEVLPQIILDQLETHKVVYVTDKKVKKKRNMDSALQRAIKRLESFSPLIKRKESDGSVKGPVSGGSMKRKSRRNKSDEDSSELDEVGRDSSGSESSDNDGPVFKRSAPVPEVTAMSDDSAGSEDEDLNGKIISSSDDDSEARRRVLKGSKKRAAVESDDEKPKDDDSDDSGLKKKKKKAYYTPKVSLTRDSDSDFLSDDDDFVVTKRSKAKSRAAKIRSESEESKSSNNKGEKRYSTEELSSDSEKSATDDHDRKKRRGRRSSPVEAVEDTKSEKKKSKKKRRRVKIMSDSDDSDDQPKKKNRKKESPEEVVIDSDSDVEEVSADSPTKGRKNIKKIISKKDLQKETKKAEEEEERRRKRIAERQSMFNGIFKPPEGEKLTQLVLDFDPETKEPLIQVDPVIVEKLKPHQASGVQFMWQACFESVEEFKKPNSVGGGCILAHCMGLGKTLQTVAFLHTVMTSDITSERIKTALVMCPLNTVTNWTNEVKMWTRHADKQLTIHKLYDEKNQESRVDALKCWQRRGGVGIIHYDSFRGLVEGKRIKKGLKEAITRCLVDPGPDIVVCDEGHVFKNEKSKMSLAVNKIRTRRRVVLTGTPLQNNLLEYHCMMQFVKPNLLGSKKEFSNRFVNPITNGQHKDSTPADVKLMKKRAHVLHKLLDGCVQRLDYSVLVPYLPPKYEYAVFIKMSEIQSKLYVHYLNSIKSTTGNLKDLIGHGNLLKHSANLSKILAHPRALELTHNRNEENSEDSSDAGSLKDFIVDGSEDSESVTVTDGDSDIDWLDNELKIVDKKKKKAEESVVKKEAEDVAESSPENQEADEAESADLIERGQDWWSKFFTSKDDMRMMEHSNKMMVLFEILKTCEGIQDKVLVFSQYLYSLDLIEEFLEALDEEARRKAGPTTFPPTYDPSVSRWRRGIEFFRIDGSTKTHDRQRNCDTFNKNTDTSKAKLFLISTKAGGLGINLVGANRVVIFDASWNPSQDMQSIFRVFRFGQTKPCYVYRLLAKGTIEEKIYNRQVVKLSLSCRVVDEHQIERHYTFDEIGKMFEYNPDEKTDRPTPDLPKDRLLADLLMSHKDIVDSYHEHDTLLQNQVDQGLTEDERRSAWDEYQSEKNRVNMTGLPTTVSGTAVDIMQAYDKMKARIRDLYPHLMEPVLDMFIQKIQKDMMDLRRQTAWFHENKGRMDIPTAITWQQRLNERKNTLSEYFSRPGFLARAMQPELQVAIRDGRINLPSTSAAPVSNLANGTNGLSITPITLAPMSSILEPSSRPTPMSNTVEPQSRPTPMSNTVEPQSRPAWHITAYPSGEGPSFQNQVRAHYGGGHRRGAFQVRRRSNPAVGGGMPSYVRTAPENVSQVNLPQSVPQDLRQVPEEIPAAARPNIPTRTMPYHPSQDEDVVNLE